ncbi:LuxR C-terminal-related transcriptional regulator [Streptosporangium lutulentum]
MVRTLARGLPNAEIGRKLKLTEATVRAHVSASRQAGPIGCRRRSWCTTRTSADRGTSQSPPRAPHRRQPERPVPPRRPATGKTPVALQFPDPGPQLLVLLFHHVIGRYRSAAASSPGPSS